MAISVEYDLRILMKSLYDFIVEPVGEKYSNTIKIGE